jgi:hypothetical protein
MRFKRIAVILLAAFAISVENVDKNVLFKPTFMVNPQDSMNDYGWLHCVIKSTEQTIFLRQFYCSRRPKPFTNDCG